MTPDFPSLLLILNTLRASLAKCDTSSTEMPTCCPLMTGLKRLVTVGSIGPSVPISAMTISSAPILMDVAALKARKGIRTLNFPARSRRRLISGQGVLESPPRLYKKRSIADPFGIESRWRLIWRTCIGEMCTRRLGLLEVTYAITRVPRFTSIFLMSSVLLLIGGQERRYAQYERAANMRKPAPKIRVSSASNFEEDK